MKDTLFFELINKHIPELSDKKAIQINDKFLTYGELNDMVTSLYQYLSKTNLNKQDRVVIYLDKSPEYIITFLALSLFGAISIPIEIGISHERFSYILSETSPKMILGEKVEGIEVEHSSIKINWDLKKILVDDNVLESFTGEFPLVLSDDTATIFFSSGSTGRPKGVLLKNIHLTAVARNLSQGIGLDQNHIDLILSPINHTDGWQRVGATLYSGGCAVLYQGALSVIGMLEDIEKYKVTGFYTPPPLIRYLLLAPTEKVNKSTITCTSVEIGSAPISKPEINLLFEKIPTANIFIHFGLTESSRATLLDTKKNTEKWHTVGKALPDVEIMISDEHGNSLPPNTEGEILFKGIQRSEQYWNREDLNTTRYRNGWLLSGDYGKIDEDGFLTYCGRRDDMLTSGGYHYFPAEVETELGPVTGVERYTIAGIKDKKGFLEDIPVAFVVPIEFDNWSSKDFMNQAKNNLPSYMVPRKVIKVKELPLTPSGKVDRKETISLYYNGE